MREQNKKFASVFGHFQESMELAARDLKEIRIRKGTGEFSVKVSLLDTVASLEREVKNALPECLENPNLRVRLIFQGRMVNENLQATLASMKIQARSVLHCVVSPPRDEVRQATSALAASVPPTTLGNMQGFDRLIRTGMTANEVAAIRTSFRPEVDMYANSSPQRPGESRDAYRFRLEEEWMARQGPTSDFVMNVSAFLNDGRTVNSGRSPLEQLLEGSGATTGYYEAGNATPMGTTQDFFSGVLIGFFIGFLVLFCVWDRNVSYRHRLGLLTGVTLSIMFESHQAAQNAAVQHADQDPSSNGGDGTNVPPATPPSNPADPGAQIPLIPAAGVQDEGVGVPSFWSR